ncbi:MAG: methyltransferase domain-containing protein [Nitrosarchaeum sp.]|nr:methyltransferase domain-containing protein [Nitrosarchaeum sp.]
MDYKKMKLDLGCSTRKPEGFFGIDILPFPGVDVVHDLNKGIPLNDNSCEIVRAHDAIEHIRDGMMIMKEIWRVLIVGGQLDILVPSTDGRGAFQDLTHVTFWNENSFGYWINPAEWVDYYRGRCLFQTDELYTTQMSIDKVCHVVFKAKKIILNRQLTI